MRLSCLRSSIETGGHQYPVFISFLPADDILKIASAPSFAPAASNETIADNVLRPPVEQWQRPLDRLRIDRIAEVFDNTGNIMPNPVLLSQNVLTHSPIDIRPQEVGQGLFSDVWTVEIAEPAVGESRPLWILDGQHRISGLAESEQKDNPIPLVLLLNDAVVAYGGDLLAKIFAQVTTSATELDYLHNEWLTFAFNLGGYDPSSSPSAHEAKRAMEATAEACRISNLADAGPANPFFNRIAFNAHASLPADRNFYYDCVELHELLQKHYYSRATAVTHMSPRDLAIQLGLALVSLKTSVPAPLGETVFFGDADHAQKYMQDALLVGVMTHLLQHGPPSDWKDVYAALAFPETDWNFRSWFVTFHGAFGTTSKKMALNVFASRFRERSLPTGSRNLAEFLRGNDASVTLRFSNLTPNGRPSAVGAKEVALKSGARLTEMIQPRRHLRLARMTDNVGSVKFMDSKLIRGEEQEYQVRQGLVLDADSANPLNLVVHMVHYGGNRSTADVIVKW